MARDLDELALWALSYFVLRAGQEKHLLVFLAEYDGSLSIEAKEFCDALRVALHGGLDRPLFIVSEGDDVFKRALSLLLCRVEGPIQPFLVSNLSDFIWFHLFQARSAENGGRTTQALSTLQSRVLSDLAPETTPLELVKYQLLCLMFEETVLTLARQPALEPEAAQALFIFLETGVLDSLRDPKKSTEKRFQILAKFARNFCDKYPVESLVFFDPLPPIAEELIVDFIEKNDLL